MANRGLSFKFVLNKLPRCDLDIFVDASLEWGIGGCCGEAFFAYPWSKLKMFEVDIISRRELLACSVGLCCFQSFVEGKFFTVYSDNQNVVAWLKKGRSSNLLGMRILAAWELMKYKLRCKISPKWLPGWHNNTADALSRGCIPWWLVRQGRECSCDLYKLAYWIAYAEEAWDSILK